MTVTNKHVGDLKSMVEGMHDVQVTLYNQVLALLREYLATVPKDERSDMRRKFLAAFNAQAMFDELSGEHELSFLTVQDAQIKSWNWCEAMALGMCSICTRLGK